MKDPTISYSKLYLSSRFNIEYKKLIFRNRVYQIPSIDEDNSRSYTDLIEIDPDQLLDDISINLFEINLSKNNITKIYFRLNPFFLKEIQLKVRKLLMSKNFQHDEVNILQIDLNKNLINLKKSIRRSYKSLINKESKVLNVKFSSDKIDNQKLFLDWIEIYQKAISRSNVFLSKKTSYLLEKAIINKEYLLGVAYEKNFAVGGMLFKLNAGHAYYSAAANNLEIEKDKKRYVGHFLMWNFITKLKELGFSNLELGNYREEINTNLRLSVNETKNDRIIRFKSGFGGELIKGFYFKKNFNL